MESPLTQLACSPGPDGAGLSDLAVLYRLLECCSTNAVEVLDLWKAFCASVAASISEASCTRNVDLRLRFGQSLLALHALGLHSPYPPSRNEPHDEVFGGWKILKRHFGRVWLKSSSLSDQVDGGRDTLGNSSANAKAVDLPRRRRLLASLAAAMPPQKRHKQSQEDVKSEQKVVKVFMASG